MEKWFRDKHTLQVHALTVDAVEMSKAVLFIFFCVLELQ